MQEPTAQYTGFKNRIINGDMRIDQRRAGASVTPTADGTYTIDRYETRISQSSKISIQQSTTAPAGFTNSMLVTSLAATTVGSSDYFAICQSIEGLNLSDFGWGTANAQTITLSFWVRSSLTGTFGGSISNGSNRNYPFTYTINSANTWEKETITIAGDTSGTWLTTNGKGLQLSLSLGSGSTFNGTAGAWGSAGFFSATGATNLVSTNGATFFITGVQLEKGTTATSFDFRSIGQELALCQRYFWKSYSTDVAIGTINSAGPIASIANAALSVYFPVYFPVEMRAAPTITFYNNTTGATGTWRDGGGTDRTMSSATPSTRLVSVSNFSTAANSTINGHLTASIEL
jgi:hypothetical protein